MQRPPKLSIGPPHPDPIVETSSLSAVQPPEPTYDLRIKEELERTKALSCLQIETLVYACQVAFKWHKVWLMASNVSCTHVTMLVFIIEASPAPC